MTDYVFEGEDNTQENRKFQAEFLDLFAKSEKYKKYWKLPQCSSKHRALFIIISKELPYKTSSRILEKIYNTIGKKEIIKFEISDKTLKKWELSNEKINCLKKMLELPEVNSKTLCKIKEFGIYGVKLFKIMQEEDDDVFLKEDYNICKNLGILFEKNRAMTKVEAQQISSNWLGFRSQLSFFLYRLKPEGAYKLLDEKELDEKDFW
jgi:hypothetical protein